MPSERASMTCSHGFSILIHSAKTHPSIKAAEKRAKRSGRNSWWEDMDQDPTHDPCDFVQQRSIIGINLQKIYHVDPWNFWGELLLQGPVPHGARDDGATESPLHQALTFIYHLRKLFSTVRIVLVISRPMTHLNDVSWAVGRTDFIYHPLLYK